MARAKKRLNKNKPVKKIEGKSNTPETGSVFLFISFLGCAVLVYYLSTAIGDGLGSQDILNSFGMLLGIGAIGWIGLSWIWKEDVFIDEDRIEITRKIFSRWTLQPTIQPEDIRRIVVGKTNMSKVRNKWTIMYVFIQLDPLWRMKRYKLNYNNYTEEQLLRIEQLLKGFPGYNGKVEEKRSRPYSKKEK